MSIAGTSVRRPILMYVFLISMSVLGLVSFFKMGLEFFPEVEIPHILVVTVYPGASLYEIESEISEKLENNLVTISDIKHMWSYSYEGFSIIHMEFEAEAKVDAAAADVRDRISMAQAELPDGAEKPVVYKFDLNAMPIIQIAISAKRPTNEIKKYIDDFVQDRLAQIGGVANVSIEGGREREVEVRVSRAALERHGITIAHIVGAIQASNLNFPVGKIKQNKEEITVRIVGEVEDPRELEEIRIPTAQGLIPLKDAAVVQGRGLSELVQYSRMGNKNEVKDAVGISISKKAGANTAEVSRKVRAELDKMKKDMPADFDVVIARDESEFVVDSLNATRNNLIEGALLAGLVVFIFLFNVRTTIIICLAMPISILMTFMLMFFSGFTLNIMTLLALSISVGMMVDNSTVLLENIYRHMQMGKTPIRAAIEGANEITMAVMASGLTNIVVFISFSLMGGIVGQFFKQFGLTMCYTYVGSLVIAFTLTPAMMSHFLKKKDLEALQSLSEAGEKRLFDRAYKSIRDLYKSILVWSLRRRFILIALVVLVFFSSVSLIAFGMIGFEFFPNPDQGKLDVQIEMPVSASLAQTNELALKLEKVVRELDETELYTMTVGGSSGFFTAFGDPDPRFASMKLNLAPRNKRKRSSDEIMDYLRTAVAQFPGGAAFTIKKTSSMGPGESAVEFEVAGPDIEVLSKLSSQLFDIIKNTKGTMNVTSSFKVGKPEIQVRVRKRDAQMRGLNTAYIGAQLRAGVYGDNTAKYRDEAGKEYDIRVRLDQVDRMSIEDIKNFPIATPMGTQVKLADVADIVPGASPTEISRKSRQRMISITTEVSGRSVGLIMGDINKAIQEKVKSGELKIPSGYTYNFSGQAEAMMDMFMQMLLVMGLGIIFVYFVMAAQFNSFFHPLAIMITIPLALIGVLYMLFITGQTLNMMSMIGNVLLIGVVVNNAIVLIDYTNLLRQRGMSKFEALTTAGPIRLRPILITSITTTMGVVPALVMSGMGNEVRRPIAAAVFGGMVTSTFLTLVVVPVVYSWLDDVAQWLGIKTDTPINETIEEMELRLYGVEQGAALGGSDDNNTGGAEFTPGSIAGPDDD